MLKLEEARILAKNICDILSPCCQLIQVAGSVRREKAEVRDIDIVALPKAVDLPGGLFGVAKVHEDRVWENLIPKALFKWGFNLEASGQELHRFTRGEDGFQVDVYRARLKTWGVILLVRTGSKEHNVKLCSLAKSKNMMLSASQGLLQGSNIVACRTEEGIFSALGLKFVEPRDREVKF